MHVLTFASDTQFLACTLRTFDALEAIAFASVSHFAYFTQTKDRVSKCTEYETEEIKKRTDETIRDHLPM